MARRPAFTPDEARNYLKTHHQSVPKTDRAAQRKARGLSQGKSLREAAGHGKSEHQYRRPRLNQITLSAISTTTTEYRLGPPPDEDQEPEDAVGNIRAPQPADLERMVRRTKGPLVVLGIHGYLIKYMEVGDGMGEQYVFVHTYLYRDQLLNILAQLPRDHEYTFDDPAYLDLAHAVLSADYHGQFQAAHSVDGWEWGYIYQWTIRDVTT